MKRRRAFVMLARLAASAALFPLAVGAQPHLYSAYIIVHCHNPEGVEIASIEGMDSHCVQIGYDDDDCIAFGASTVETHNEPIPVPAGTHTVTAKFNGMTQEQGVSLSVNETKVLTFTFERTEFDLVNWINTDLAVEIMSSVSGTHRYQGGPRPPNGWSFEDVDYDYFPDETEGRASSWVRIAHSTQGWWDDPSMYSVMNYDVSALLIFDGTKSIQHVKASYSVSGNGPVSVGVGAAVYGIDVNSCSFPKNITLFDNWFVQAVGKNYPNITMGVGLFEAYRGDRLDGYHLSAVPANRDCGTASVWLTFDLSWFDEEGCWAGMHSTTVLDDNYLLDERNEGSLQLAKMTSVPYDLLGTGVGGPGKKPPVASFTYSPQHPSPAEEVDFNASESYDPDGAIVQYNWDFGDGTVAEGRLATHAYAETGQYTAILVVTDNDGLKDCTLRPVQIEQSPPRIEEIIITPQQDAMTRHDVTFEAKISDAPGFEVWAIDWLLTDAESGRVDLYSSGSNPYTTQPAAGTHGKKKVICTIFYRNISTGRGGVDSEPKEFLLFFDKYQLALGHWDPKRVPNWFVYWARDGAVPSIILAGAEYDPSGGGYGGYDPNTDRIYLYPQAAEQHYPCVVKLETHFGTEKFGGPDVTGIDCAAEAVAHELYHKWVNRQWKTGVFSEPDHDRGLEAPDCDDELPDFYETETSFTSNSDTDTYDLEHKKSCNGDILDQYRRYGDQEYMAMSAAKGAKGDKERDWANPGKQTSVRKFLLPSERRASGVATFSQKSVPETRFTGAYSDHGSDTNGNGLYDYLTVTVGIDIPSPGRYDLISSLSDTNGNTIGLVNEPHTFEAGTNEVELNFDGTLIHHFRVDGPYELSLTLTDDDGNEIRSENNAYLTSPYSYTAFEGEQIWFTGNYSDHSTDTDADGVYDYLTVEVETNTTIPGDYTVRGYLYDDSENPIGFASTSTYADIGTLTTQLNFPGLSIGLAGKDGPYIVRYLALGDGRDMPLDFVLDAYTTAAYDHTDFRPTEAAFGDVFSDHGQDTNGDGLLEFLIVEVLVDVTVPRNYTLAGYLYDLDNKEVVWATTDSYLDAGLQSVVVSFDGPGIFTHGVNGPYEFRYAVLYDENGSLSDILSNPYTTSSYSYTDFQRPEASAFRVAGLGRLANGRLRLDFSTVLGGAYHLEVCDSLVGSTWVQTPFFDTEGGTEAQESIQGSGAVLSIYVSPTGNRAFYRIAGP